MQLDKQLQDLRRSKQHRLLDLELLRLDQARGLPTSETPVGVANDWDECLSMKQFDERFRRLIRI
jgi:hypothetical protein